MKASKLADLGGLILVALLLFVFSFLLVHNEGEDTLGAGEVVDKQRALKLGKGSPRSQGAGSGSASVPRLFSLPLFQSLRPGHSSEDKEEAAEADGY